MSRKKKRIPAYTFWGLDEGKKFHAERFSLRDFPTPKLIQIPYRVTYFAIRLIVNGKGKVYIDNIPHELKPNFLFMTNPSEIKRYDPDPSENLEAMVIAFNKEFLTLLGLEEEILTIIYQMSKELAVYLNEEDEKMIRGMFDLVFAEYETKRDVQFYQELILASMVRTILQYLWRMTRAREIDPAGLPYRTTYVSFLNAVEQNFKKLHQVSEYAEILNIHDKTLNRACKALTDLSASKVIQLRLDFEAKRLLVSQPLSVKEIAYELGFKEAAHFNKFFRNLNGMAPGQFRDKILEEYHAHDEIAATP